ncbi:hypothetical protein [Actinomyces oris]|nr:hypothetical protein [Actinomyces oris]
MPTRVASTSITNGRSALIPAVGECSPPRPVTLLVSVSSLAPARPTAGT